jgi:hypothetical protein
MKGRGLPIPRICNLVMACLRLVVLQSACCYQFNPSAELHNLGMSQVWVILDRP